MKILLFPTIVALVAGVGVFLWGGAAALMLFLLLATLETTLSFDNAVVNAKILTRMSALWQQRFLTWGILIAVFGTRLVLPVLIVAAAAWLTPWAVVQLALFDPVQYGEHLRHAHVSIAAFGSAFLLLVSLKYFFNDRKTVHWIKSVERLLSRWGGIEAIEIALVLLILLGASFLAPHEAAAILAAGLVGVVLFIVIQGFADVFESGAEHATEVATKASVALFVYLNVLDSAFSLDGVVAAFAITTSVLIIVAGLGVGALFVRSFTLMLVRAKTLDTLVYLEHGAHYAILGLAIAMLVGIFVHVPEVITGLVGFVFIALAYLSSRREYLKQTA
ncbi:DUF475 domain-containing protein [Candidatus Parcubacteria bacterium]|nr:MAG: DUF475 domain-containing protein [Candidatus Parcubacteria bacterium]